jgi:hypothetical protein
MTSLPRRLGGRPDADCYFDASHELSERCEMVASIEIQRERARSSFGRTST